MNGKSKDLDQLLDRALDEIRDSRMDPAAEQSAADRVWTAVSQEIQMATEQSEEPRQIRDCSDFQALIPAYMRDGLTDAKALLLEDHVVVDVVGGPDPALGIVGAHHPELAVDPGCALPACGVDMPDDKLAVARDGIGPRAVDLAPRGTVPLATGEVPEDGVRHTLVDPEDDMPGDLPDDLPDDGIDDTPFDGDGGTPDGGGGGGGGGGCFVRNIIW